MGSGILFGMLKLVDPALELQTSFLETWQEVQEAGEDAQSWFNWGRDETIDELRDPETFRSWIESMKEFRDVKSRVAEDGTILVGNTVLWPVLDGEVIGRVSIRHELTPALLEIGGHIGYIVRPKYRMLGHATELLRQSLQVAKRLGIDPALVTCDESNVGSRKVIETNGGVLEDVRFEKRRYWVPTS